MDFPFTDDEVSDALTTADQTVGPGGVAMNITERIADMLRRHHPDSPNALAHVRREPYLLAAANRVAARLSSQDIYATSSTRSLTHSDSEPPQRKPGR